jgi:hypothetical protein
VAALAAVLTLTTTHAYQQHTPQECNDFKALVKKQEALRVQDQKALNQCLAHHGSCSEASIADLSNAIGLLDQEILALLLDYTDCAVSTGPQVPPKPSLQVRIDPLAWRANTRDDARDDHPRREWVRGTDGHLYSKRTEAAQAQWIDEGMPVAGQIAVGPKGVSAASWVPAHPINRLQFWNSEHAFVVGDDGANHFWELSRDLPGIPVETVQWCSAPAGLFSLAGNSTAAVTWNDRGTFKVEVVAIDVAGYLERWTRSTSKGGCGGFTASGTTTPQPTAMQGSQIAAINVGGLPEFFIHTLNNTIAVEYWNGKAWAWSDGGAPANVSFKDPHLAATDWTSNGASSGDAWAVGSDGNLWQGRFSVPDKWTWTSMDNPFNLLGAGTRSITAGHFNNNGASAVDYEEVAIASSEPAKNFLAVRLFDPNKGWGAWTQTAPFTDGDHLQEMDGFTHTDGTRSLFTSAAVGKSNYLIRYSPQNQSAWEFHGWYWASSDRNVWTQAPNIPGGLAEAFVADSPSGANNFSSASAMDCSNNEIHVRYSSSYDDGASWGNSAKLPEYYPAKGRATLNGDAVVDYDANGTAYVSALNGQVDVCNDGGNSCDGSQPYNTAIYYVTTDNGGATFSNPVLVAKKEGPCDASNVLDHPWMAIDRATGRKHFLWHPINSSSIRYRYQDKGNAGAFHPPQNDPNFADGWPIYNRAGPGPAVPMLVVTADGTPYASMQTAGGLVVCRIDLGKTPPACGATFSLPGRYLSKSRSMSSNGVTIFTLGAHQLAAAAGSPNRLHVVTQATDGCTAGTRLDVYFQGLTYDSGRDMLTADTNEPVRINDNAANDCTDQFQPAVTSTADGNVYVGWYDRRETMNGKSNYFIVPYLAVSTDGGRTFGKNFQLSGPNTPVPIDPAQLPVNCTHGQSIRFLGDYHIVRGGTQHGHMVFAGKPDMFFNVGQWVFGSRFWGF